ncbi:MAG: IMP dehydrogenase [Proteobacteria bacterium]|nr:IMP dehydrogenase [Pseudomonadota bacterium]
MSANQLRPRPGDIKEGLTFDDILVVPAYSQVLPSGTSLETRLTRRLKLKIPLVSAAMDTVTEFRLAIALAGEGGLGFIHKNMSAEEQGEQVKKVKKFASEVVTDPITTSPDSTIAQVIKLMETNNISGVPVVRGNRLCGIVTNRDLRFVEQPDQPVSTVMTGEDKLITVKPDTSRHEIESLLHTHRIEKVLVVDDNFELRGLVTVKDTQKLREFPNACWDDRNRLRAGAAIGVNDRHRAELLVDQQVDVLAVDSAHGHSAGVIDMLDWLKKNYPNTEVVAGNIATAEAARALVDHGADGLKVGIGPGSICTTRIVAGVGVPQITALMNVLEAVADSDVPVISDGGIRYSGDVVKALAVGAEAVMVGSLLAGTEESPGEIEYFQGRTYKSYRGMGSIGAMKKGSADRYFQAESRSSKLVPEGIEARVPYRGQVREVVYQVLGGLRAGMGYCGSANLGELRANARLLKISAAGVREGHPHDVTVVKESAHEYPQD